MVYYYLFSVFLSFHVSFNVKMTLSRVKITQDYVSELLKAVKITRLLFRLSRKGSQNGGQLNIGNIVMERSRTLIITTPVDLLLI